MSDKGYVNYFEILGLDESAKPGEVRTTYKSKMKDLVMEIARVEITEERRAHYLLEMAKLNAAMYLLRDGDARGAYWKARGELIELEQQWRDAADGATSEADTLRRTYDAKLRHFLSRYIEEAMLEAGRDKGCVEVSHWDEAHERHASRILRHFRQSLYQQILERLPYYEVTTPTIDWEERKEAVGRRLKSDPSDPSDRSDPRSKDEVEGGPACYDAIARAVCDGDIVNFRLLFLPLSPSRESSTESFDMPKYAYLLPDEETLADPHFAECLAQVVEPANMRHIEQELAANRPAQLPSSLLLTLADHAVRLAKYSNAAQAYEMLRVRARMQQEFLAQADEALKEAAGGLDSSSSLRRAVRGYVIATGLAYDYAAFPEPLPVIPDFQTRALMLHADYPETPDNSIGMRETHLLLQTALGYLLLEPEIAARLDALAPEIQIAFLKELVLQRDPQWPSFLERYVEASAALADFASRLTRRETAATLAEEVQRQLAEDPLRIPALLLGRTIENAEWWQYLKELVCDHPAAALFVSRQAIGNLETLIPRHRADSPVAQALGLPGA